MSKTATSQITKKIVPQNVVNVGSATVSTVAINKETIMIVPCLVDGIGDQVDSVLVQGV